MISLCNRVCELSIIKISVESKGFAILYDLEEIERVKTRNKRVHIDLMDSNDLTYKEYEA